MKIKKLGTDAAVISAVGLVGAAPANAKLKRINIGSNPAGSVYFLLAGGFAKMFQKQTKIRSVAQPHAGNVVARLNGTGMKDSIIVQSQNIAAFVPTVGAPVLPSVGEPAAPRLALVALLAGLALTGIGGTFLLWRRFSTA